MNDLVERPSLQSPSLRRHPLIGHWVTFEDHGEVLVRSGKVELGQGVVTALLKIAADELCVSPHRVRMLQVSTLTSPNEDYTSGSFSISHSGSAIRAACAAARALLLEAASVKGGGAIDGLIVVDGAVMLPGGRLTYWDALSREMLDRPISDVPFIELRPAPADDIQRIDLPAKFRGKPVFIQDMDLPGMLHGRVVRPAGAPRRLTVFDDSRAAKIPNLVAIIREGDFLGVVAEREEAAISAAECLAADCLWSPMTFVSPPEDGSWLMQHASPPEVLFQSASPPPAGGGGSLSAIYRKPYMAHASIGPSCGMARVGQDGLVEIWSHTQGPFPLRREIAGVLQLPESQVVVSHVQGAGCYGHNGAEDAALDAVIMARATAGRPVKVQWSRGDEFGNEPYSPQMMMRLAGSLGDDGRIVDWSHELWSNGHTARPGRANGLTLLAAAERLNPPVDPPLPYGGSQRNAVPLYDFPSAKIIQHPVTYAPVRVSSMRSLGAYANVFAIESFLDELAAEAGQDPVAFRLRHLADERGRAVIEAAASRAGWGDQRPEGAGQGFGFARYKNTGSYCAVVAEVNAEAKLGLARLTLVVEAGRVISLDGVLNQIEGGAIQAASWTLKESAPVDGETRPLNWRDYPILKFSEVPEVDTFVIDRPDLPSLGVGECAHGPVAAAIANAFAAVYGVRVRDLPITQERVLAAMAD
jgi:nicotinate dehydrogenase subunit B